MATAAASDGRPPPSWEWYAEAADEPVPGYKVEAAKSDRSKCVATGNKKTPAKHGDDAEIAKGELRCGHLDPEAGSYGRWHHLACWRVPASIWLGLPGAKVKDPAAFEAALLAMSQLALCGFAELSPELRAQFVAHVMNRKNHARLTKNSKARVPLDEQGGHGCGEYEEGGAGPAGPAAAGAAKAEPSTALVPSAAPASGGLFVAPRPGVNGALAGSLGGQTFVLTGLFPELGGGAGLDLGKARCKALIESFGGRVTGSVSGKTSYLVVGKAPGASKVSQAVAKGVPTVDLAGLKAVLEGGPGASLADAPPAHIGEFSTGAQRAPPPISPLRLGRLLSPLSAAGAARWTAGDPPPARAFPPKPCAQATTATASGASSRTTNGPTCPSSRRRRSPRRRRGAAAGSGSAPPRTTTTTTSEGEGAAGARGGAAAPPGCSRRTRPRLGQTAGKEKERKGRREGIIGVWEQEKKKEGGIDRPQQLSAPAAAAAVWP